MAFPQPPKPTSLLGYHRVLSPTASVRVSPLCLGAMNFGSAWSSFMGECSKETCFAILDSFYEQGGNFIDTANVYQSGESEQWIGEWMAARGNRDEIVLATKFSSPSKIGARMGSNYAGNSSKSMKFAFEGSLQRLQTEYVDLLWVHAWDYTTSVSELMNGLNHLVANGKVLYLGISDTPAWVVVKCNEYARQHGLTQFCVYQGYWSAAVRDFERDILPMCEAEGMGLMPWGTLGRGQFKSAEEFNAAEREGRKMGPQTEANRKVALKLDELAKKKGTQITSVALAYIMHKAPYVFPIIGGRKIEHLQSNIEALGVELTDEEVDEIEAAEPFDLGFPANFLIAEAAQKYSTRFTFKDYRIHRLVGGYLEAPPKQRPIPPRQGEKDLERQQQG
ncbi:hypothetical protein Q7P37_010617 [Cladosporium fusiforme]